MIRVKCKTCGGTGKAPLSETLEETLLQVRLAPYGSAVQYARFFEGVGTTAINQRLEDLRKVGLILRTRHGKSWLYFPVKGKR